MIQTIDGLVIRETNYSDNDKLLTILTAENGLMRAYVKGARSLKSPKLAACGLLCYSRFSLSGKEGSYFVSQATVNESFYNIRLDVEKTALACYFCELCRFLTGEFVESGELLRLMLNALYLLASGKKPPKLVKPVFELRGLSIAGHMPDLTGCMECGQYEGQLYLLLREGRLICEHCLNQKKTAGIRYPLSPPVLYAMRYILFSPFEKIFSFTLSDEGLMQLSGASESFLLSQLEREFPTLTFYKTFSIGEEPT